MKKHPDCRWKGRTIKTNRKNLLIEGYYVYFQKEKSLLDADVDFLN